ncbi:MAG: outer membrane protein assembly factor BamC [Methylococcaceae bacterium]
MQVIFKGLLIALTLASCGGGDSRYKDTQMLERPPVLAIERRLDQEIIEPDESVVPEKSDSLGLGSAVYLVETTPPQLKIKQSFDDAWRSLGLALKQSRIKITDHDRDKGLYYVYYYQKNLFENAAGLFQDEQEESRHDANFLLKLEQDGAEINVTATSLNAEQAGPIANQDGYDDSATTDVEDLLQVLYEALHDDLKEE